MNANELDLRKKPPSMSALQRAKRTAAQGEVVNFCPFGCDGPDLDEHGYCPHLVGFTTDGRTYEPRVRRSADGRIITDGSRPKKIQSGDQLVRITTSARVYRRESSPELVRRPDEGGENPLFLDPEELELQQKLAELKNPVLDGPARVGRTSYDADDDSELERATRPA